VSAISFQDEAQGQSVIVKAPPELSFEVIAAAGKKIRDVCDGQIVAEFVTEWRGRRFRTLEMVTLDRPHRIALSMD
jgi:hypothetical protein